MIMPNECASTAARARRNKVDFIADQEQRIYVEIANAQLAKLGLDSTQIAAALDAQNAIAASGIYTTPDDRVFVRPSGQFQDLAAVGNTLIRLNNRTVAAGRYCDHLRGYIDPPTQQMRFDQQTVLGIGVTMAPDGDVIEFGKAADSGHTPSAVGICYPG